MSAANIKRVNKKFFGKAKKMFLIGAWDFYDIVNQVHYDRTMV